MNRRGRLSSNNYRLRQLLQIEVLDTSSLAACRFLVFSHSNYTTPKKLKNENIHSTVYSKINNLYYLYQLINKYLCVRNMQTQSINPLIQFVEKWNFTSMIQECYTIKNVNKVNLHKFTLDILRVAMQPYNLTLTWIN